MSRSRRVYEEHDNFPYHFVFPALAFIIPMICLCLCCYCQKRARDRLNRLSYIYAGLNKTPHLMIRGEMVSTADPIAIAKMNTMNMKKQMAQVSESELVFPAQRRNGMCHTVTQCDTIAQKNSKCKIMQKV
jgi:hypothetical protein